MSFYLYRSSKLSYLILFLYLQQATAWTCPCKKGKEEIHETKSIYLAQPCDFSMPNPKKVINHYREQVQNSVKHKPFSSICLKCNICLAIAAKINQVFSEVTSEYLKRPYEKVMPIVVEKLNSLCSSGFENYDLRKFEHHQMITDNLQCSKHVSTEMDGQWTKKYLRFHDTLCSCKLFYNFFLTGLLQKHPGCTLKIYFILIYRLREMCRMYANYIDVQHAFNSYMNGTNDISSYMCRNKGIFRDCIRVDLTNPSLSPNQANSLDVYTVNCAN